MISGASETWLAVRVFIDMGGHGPYVWVVYLTAVVLLVANYLKFRLDHGRTVRTLRALYGEGDGFDKISTDRES